MLEVQIVRMYICHFLCHDDKEVREGDFPCAILVYFTNHLFNLLLLRFEPQSSHCNLEQSEEGL